MNKEVDTFMSHNNIIIIILNLRIYFYGINSFFSVLITDYQEGI